MDEATVRGLVENINRFRPKLLLVFPSPMNMIAHTIRQRGLRLEHHPELINVSGETFFDCQRRNIESVFTRSKIEDSYGSVELGEIAHQIDHGLEIFANVAYVETHPNEASRNEMIVTRLGLTDFPFVRYRMRDVADVEFCTDPQGRQRFVITRIEGKDTNHILTAAGLRLYPSFFNQLVNQLNRNCGNEIVEIKVFERGQRELEIHFITRGKTHQASIRRQCESLLADVAGDGMHMDIRFVEFIDHDYRRKYRVIERAGDVEFAGGIVGDESKRETMLEIEAHSAGQPSPGI
jgi:phenylacetate-CoA ligase